MATSGRGIAGFLYVSDEEEDRQLRAEAPKKREWEREELGESLDVAKKARSYKQAKKGKENTINGKSAQKTPPVESTDAVAVDDDADADAECWSLNG